MFWSVKIQGVHANSKEIVQDWQDKTYMRTRTTSHVKPYHVHDSPSRLSNEAINCEAVTEGDRYWQ